MGAVKEHYHEKIVAMQYRTNFDCEVWLKERELSACCDAPIIYTDDHIVCSLCESKVLKS